MATTKTLKDELLALENQYWQAMKDKDAGTAIRLTDDRCIVVGAQGVSQISKEMMGEMLGGGAWTIEGFKLDDTAELRMLGDDVAVLAYNAHEDLTVDGKPVQLDAAQASTWVRRDGQWRCALHTESIAGDPYGRDRQPRA